VAKPALSAFVMTFTSSWVAYTQSNGFVPIVLDFVETVHKIEDVNVTPKLMRTVEALFVLDALSRLPLTIKDLESTPRIRTTVVLASQDTES
jgi:hypothetical protein